MVPTVKEILTEAVPWEMFTEMYPETASKIEGAMLKACELHRQECLKQAADKAQKSFIPSSGKGGGYYVVNKDSILNAYSKKNIR